MELLYKDEHFSCFNYNSKKSLIEVIEKERGDSFELNSKRSSIIFVLTGKIKVSMGLLNDKVIEEGRMFVHPGIFKGTVNIEEKTTLIVMILNTNFSFCEHFSIEKLCEDNEKNIKDDIFSLEINSLTKSYLQLLEQYIRDGLRCIYFFELKLKEFLYILKAYHPKEDLQLFFHPILNRDTEFSKQVLENVGKVKTVKELAKELNYSLSGFEKRFKRVFDISASKWMEQNKARAIYHEINCSNKTIMEIAYEFQFSPSQLNDYCKRIFKKTPKQLRKEDK